MYNQKFVATLKSNGKVLREQGDTVYLPFGSEYSVLLKNLNTVRAQVKIEIDGQDVLNGSRLVVNPNSDLELERFLKDNLRGNRFKFIERTSSIEDHRGVGASDGIVRIEFQYEKVYAPSPLYPNTTPWGGVYYQDAGTIRGQSFVNNVASATSLNSVQCSVTNYKSIDNDAGITVPGSISTQKFDTISGFPVEWQTHVIVLQLKGETEYNKIVKPITVKHKPKCVTCGKVNKATSKFCSNCGTSLEIV
jgi:hypothetical protein